MPAQGRGHSDASDASSDTQALMEGRSQSDASILRYTGTGGGVQPK